MTTAYQILATRINEAAEGKVLDISSLNIDNNSIFKTNKSEIIQTNKKKLKDYL